MVNELLITVLEVRNKNKGFLLTDTISDADIEEVILESQTTVFNRIGGLYDDTQINSTNCPKDLKLCFKLLAAGDLIITNYPDKPNAVTVGQGYRKDAFDDLKSILSEERRLKNLPKDNTPAVVPFLSVSNDIDDKADTFISNLDNYYK